MVTYALTLSGLLVFTYTYIISNIDIERLRGCLPPWEMALYDIISMSEYISLPF